MAKPVAFRSLLPQFLDSARDPLPPAVNAERLRKGLSSLDVFVVDLLGEGEGVEGKMGSTGIREWIVKRRAREEGP